MAWTEQDYQEIVARLMANSIGVNEVPNADKADDVTSLPAFKPSGSDSEASVVNYPLEFLKGEQGEPGIQGEPGKSFKVAGEYATLEALKSAVPDGSAVDGFMAVGTEAPYDYYAWVNGEWVSQGKIAGGNVIVLPREILDLTGSSSSEEIFATFGGIDKYKDLLEKLSANNYLVQIGEPSLGSLRHIYTLVEYSVKFASNKQSGALSLNIYNEDQQLRRLHFYLEDNGTTARCGEASTFQLVKDSDVLTKTNTSSFTPTGDYQPATKKYVDDSISTARSFGYMMGLTEIDASGLDENTWYPVTIASGERMNIRVEVLVSLDSGTKPSWSTHERGFSTRKIWEFAPYAWGINRDSKTTIYLSDFLHTDIDPVRGLGNLSHFDTCYVFVRGGGKYHFYASHEAKVILHTDTYAPGDQSVSPTTETPAGIVANIATKEYVDDIAYGKVIVVSDISKFLYSVNLNGTDAEQRTIDLFGSIDNFKNVVADIFANHTRYYFHIYSNPNNNCIELGCVNAWIANDSTSYELHFVITYFGNNPVKMFTNRISIVSNDDIRESKVIIASLVNSDNINTLTKKTSAEYKAIGSKDNETMYAITDA